MKLFHQKSFRIIVSALFVGLCLHVQARDIATVQNQRMTLMEYVMQERPVLAGLITKAGLTPILSGNTPHTLLAPPEADLKKLEQLSSARLRAVLSGHILKGTYQESDFKEGASIETLAHTKVTVYRKKNYTLIDGVRIEKPITAVGNGVLVNISEKLSL